MYKQGDEEVSQPVVKAYDAKHNVDWDDTALVNGWSEGRDGGIALR